VRGGAEDSESRKRRRTGGSDGAFARALTPLRKRATCAERTAATTHKRDLLVGGRWRCAEQNAEQEPDATLSARRIVIQSSASRFPSGLVATLLRVRTD
jgi:hypothetical protein